MESRLMIDSRTIEISNEQCMAVRQREIVTRPADVAREALRIQRQRTMTDSQQLIQEGDAQNSNN